MIAVVAGIVGGVIGLIVLAAVLSSTGRSGGEWVGTIALGLGILGIVELQNWRKKRRRPQSH